MAALCNVVLASYFINDSIVCVFSVARRLLHSLQIVVEKKALLGERKKKEMQVDMEHSNSLCLSTTFCMNAFWIGAPS